MTSQRVTKVGRNDPCPCGSGDKYKRCCERKEAQEAEGSWWARHIVHLLIVAVVLGVAGFAVAIAMQDNRAGADAGPGRVWSEEHGHWHNAGGSGGGRPCP